MEAFWKKPVLPRSEARPVPLPMLVGIAALGALTLAIGFMPQPLILFSQSAAAALLEPAAYMSAVLAPDPILEARP